MKIKIDDEIYTMSAIQYMTSDPLCEYRDSAVLRFGKYAVIPDAFDDMPWACGDDTDDLHDMSDYCIVGATVYYRDGTAEIHVGKKTQSEIDAEREQMITDLAEMLTDEQAIGIVAAYPEWETGKAYSVSDRVRVGETLYKCITAHTAQSGWEPAAAPSLWTRVSLDEWPEWVQPLGAHDAYGNGAKVTHSGYHWISTMESNIYEPGTYGWERS